ncbi:MAG: histidine phosphatase family protein [Halopseudomonas sp.]|uniref:histidine phosphatase family protein n=1 Tax=Halopseudomonas sp. TaxID=2901191 RepID=UPI00300203BF
MGSIYLIRHGQASLGAANYDVLSPLGIQQSRLCGEFYQQQGLRLDHCYAGEMQRQIDTGRHALAAMQQNDCPMDIDSAFNEYHSDQVLTTYLPKVIERIPEAEFYVSNAGQHRKEFQQVFSSAINLWITDVTDNAECPPWSGFVAQVEAGLQRVMAKHTASGQNIAIFTSGGVITAALQLITQMPATSAFELNWQIVNTSVSRLQYRKDKLSLAAFNSQAHLDVHQRSEWVSFR